MKKDVISPLQWNAKSIIKDYINAKPVRKNSDSAVDESQKSNQDQKKRMEKNFKT